MGGIVNGGIRMVVLEWWYYMVALSGGIEMCHAGPLNLQRGFVIVK